jgi:hypothetical protein
MEKGFLFLKNGNYWYRRDESRRYRGGILVTSRCIATPQVILFLKKY